jgi:hypothetical protein
MRRTLAVVLLVGLSATIAKADDKPTPPWPPSTLTPEKDWRLAKQAGGQPQKIGILTYYPNKGGGYTFVEGKHIAFYALPYMPTSHEYLVDVPISVRDDNGITETRMVLKSGRFSTIGASPMRFGGQTVYQSGMFNAGHDILRRYDAPIAEWSRDAPDGKFRLTIMDILDEEDRETRLKLKSIVPVLEHTEHSR